MEKRHCYPIFLFFLMICFVASVPSIAADQRDFLDSLKDSVPPSVDIQKRAAQRLERDGEISEAKFAGDSAGAATILAANHSPRALTPSKTETGFRPAPATIAPQAMRTIGLELVGTVVSNNSETTLAIITDQSTKKQRVYHEGDRIGQKALVKKIMRNRVIIDAGNGDIVLSMLHKGSSSPSSMAPAPRRAMSDPEPAQPTSEQTPVNSQNARARNLTVSLDRQEVEDSLSDVSQVVEQLQLSPMTANNRPDGIEITNIPSGSFLLKMGLGNRDKIMSVNGKAISSPDQVSAFLESLKQGGDFVVKVKIRGDHWVRVRRLQLNIK